MELFIDVRNILLYLWGLFTLITIKIHRRTHRLTRGKDVQAFYFSYDTANKSFLRGYA